SGFADLTAGDFLSNPILAFTSENKARFINPKNTDVPRLDKFFFENNVFYNEQPFCELISAEFYELDFSPCDHDDDDYGHGHHDSCDKDHEKEFDKLREKIVLDLTLKVLQTQQVRVGGTTTTRQSGC
ncbi:Uracil permease, partial [Bacillus cereus]